MEYVWMGLVIGAMSFGHCLGMCGPFALHLAQGRSAAGTLGRQLLWQAGKTTTYVFLGAVAGFFGQIVGSWQLPWAQKGLTWLAGGVMVVMGLAMLGLGAVRRRGEQPDSHNKTHGQVARVTHGQDAHATGRDAHATGLLSSIFGQFFAQPTPSGAFVMGIATGFLPCGIVWGALAMSLDSRSVLIGMATMAAMGVGTVWSLLILGMTGGMVKARLRRWAAPVGGVILIVLGLTTALRGSALMHQILPPAYHAAQSASQPCCGQPPEGPK